MVGVLFVCHANICRSPMAEGIFRHLLAEKGLTDHVTVDSAAVSDVEAGSPMDMEANAELVRRGLPRSGHIARQLVAEDYDRFNFILVMDMDNYYRAKQYFGGDPLRKVGLLMAYTDQPREVDDPWMTGRFARAFDEIEEGCRAFLAEMISSKSIDA